MTDSTPTPTSATAGDFATSTLELSTPQTPRELIEDRLERAAYANTMTERCVHLAIAAGVGLTIALGEPLPEDIDPMPPLTLDELRVVRNGDRR